MPVPTMSDTANVPIRFKDAAQALEIGADLDLFETRTRAFCQKGDYKSAYSELNKYSESKGRKVQCLLLKSEVERHQDKVKEALEDIEQALKLEPQSKQGRAEVVSLKAENGDVVGAVRRARRRPAWRAAASHAPATQEEAAPGCPA